MESMELSRLLATVPVANGAVREKRHGGTLVLWVPIRRRWWMRPPLTWVPGVRFRQEKGVALDALGQEVWRACDGQSTTEQIVEGFASRHRLRFHDARISVMTFLGMLMQRNLVALAGRGEARGGGERVMGASDGRGL